MISDGVGVTSDRPRAYRTVMQPDTRKRKTSSRKISSFQDLCARLTELETQQKELETQQAEVRRALVERMTLASGRVDFTATLASLRRDELSIVEALSEQLPDVFRSEVLPKLDLRATLNLAQVSKSCRDAVWSVDGVRSMKAKLKGKVIYRPGKYHRHLGTWRIPCENPLCFAAAFGSLTAVKAILGSGEDVNQPVNDVAITALYLAAYYDHIALVKLLIEAGADVDKKTTNGSTSLDVAAQNGHTSCVMALLRAGADVNLAFNDGRTPIYYAARFGHETCVALLIRAGADVRKCNDDRITPMQVASREGHTRIVKLLKDAGA